MTKVTLEPSSILRYVPMVLPPDSVINAAPDALAALLHAVNQALGLQLVGVNENTDETVQVDGGVLPGNWNARSPDFTFRYRESSSNQVLLVKIMKLGSKTQIHGILEQREQTTSAEITTSEFVSPTFFQSQQATADSEPLVHGFVSSDRVAELITKYTKDVLTPLLPNLNYEPRLDERSSSPPPPSNERPGRSRLLDDRENREKQPPLHQPYELPNRQNNPLEVGRSDLDPIPNPFAGRSPIQPLNPGGGMYVGPGHPIFGGGQQPGAGGRPTGPWGGDGFLPPMGAPPGARFDPVGPFGRGGGGGFGGGMGGFPGGGPPGRGGPRGGPFSGEPDNDEFLPPRFGGGSNSHDNMYM